MTFRLAATQAPHAGWLNGATDADARQYFLRPTQQVPNGPRIDAAIAGAAPGDFDTVWTDVSGDIFRVRRADDGTLAAILDWVPHQVWHAATEQLLLGGSRGTLKLTAYADEVGQWREVAMPAALGRSINGTAHFYGNIAQDAAGNVYYGTCSLAAQTWRRNPVTETWTQLANTPSYAQLGSSMEWFPEANSGSGGLIKSLDFATSTLRVILLNAAGTTWSTLASGVPNSQHALLRYHPSHARVLVLGGTNTQTAATFLEAGGTATASTTACPANIHGMSPACWVIAHPSGCWLVRSGADSHVYAAWPNGTYDDITWVDLGAAPDAALTNPTAAWEAARSVVLITAESGLFAWTPPTLSPPGTSAIIAAAGVATTSTLAGSSTARSAITPASGAATASTLTGRSTAQAAITPAAGVATTGTLASDGSRASIVPASGVATTSTLVGKSTAGASIVPAAGVATGVTLGSGGTVEPPAPPPAPTPGGGGGGYSPPRQRYAEGEEEESFREVMKHLKRPKKTEEAEVLEIIMALAAAGVLD